MLPTSAFQHFILEDITGELTGSEFIELDERMKYRVRCTIKEPKRTVYTIYNALDEARTPGRTAAGMSAISLLEYGEKNSLGLVSYPATPCIPMKNYLVKTNNKGSSKLKQRKFRASDGQEYCWCWRAYADHEWTCYSSTGKQIAHYAMKPECEPPYVGSSGSALVVEEAYPHLADEILTSLLIMRHIQKYNL
ncbi:hypothetical protein HGRIS_003181 [Hohenbuehelia grisea]|uniref:DUF6593 domain-containing protein n=1 Tax=Hohenbuehelia grisea TaxID=104357 RepID=A0ABR3JPJ7_9AGAR